MKQLILLTSVFMSLSFVACKREYTCSCRSSTTVEIGAEVIKEKDMDAAVKTCTAKEENYQWSFPSAGVKCGLK